MGNIFIQGASAETVASNIQQAERSSSVGLGIPEIVALGAGIAVGCAICYLGYRAYKHRRRPNVSIFENKKSLKNINELLSKQEHIHNLDSQNLRDWFSKNHMNNSEAKLMIAIPSETVINAIGYSLSNSEVNLEKSIIQAIYNSKTGQVYKLRFVTYTSIESNLQAKLLENNGLVILDD